MFLIVFSIVHPMEVLHESKNKVHMLGTTNNLHVTRVKTFLLCLFYQIEAGTELMSDEVSTDRTN